MSRGGMQLNLRYDMSSPVFGAPSDACLQYLEACGSNTAVTFQALLGGLDPELSWTSLLSFETAVLPRLLDEGRIQPPHAASAGPLDFRRIL